MEQATEVFAAISLLVIRRINEERAWHFRVGGAFALLISGFLWWIRFRS
jgi:hypothetical protein